MDPESGLISVKDDLRKEPDSEYRVSSKTFLLLSAIVLPTKICLVIGGYYLKDSISFQIEVTARDLGTPSFSATATLTVYVEHIATVAPDSGLGFADSLYK